MPDYGIPGKRQVQKLVVRGLWQRTKYRRMDQTIELEW